MKYRSKFLKEMQQGGGLSVFAPNPQPYRAPLQGLNPQVFQYNVNTAPLDTSNLIQVMQTKDVMDIKREQAAIERQKLTVEKELKEQELEYKKAKMSLDFYSSMLKMTGMKPGAGGQPVIDDITNSVRNQKNREILAQIDLLDKEMVDLSSDLFNKNNPGKITNMIMKRNNLQKSITSTVEEQAERATTANLEKILKGETKGMEVNPELFEKFYGQRREYWNGKDNGYKPGVTLNQAGMVVDMARYRKDIDKMYTDINKSWDMSLDPYVKESGIANVLITETKKAYNDAETASTQMATAIFNNRELRAGFGIDAGIKLFDESISDAEHIQRIKEIIKPKIAFDDDALDKARTLKAQMMASDPIAKQPTVIRYEGGVNSTITKSSKSDNTYSTNRVETRTTDANVQNTIDINRTGPEKINTVLPALSKEGQARSMLVMDELVKQGYDPNLAGVDKIISNYISSEAGKKAIAKDIDGAVEGLKKKLNEAGLLKFIKQREEEIEKALYPMGRPGGVKKQEASSTKTTTTTKPAAKKKTALEIIKEKRGK